MQSILSIDSIGELISFGVWGLVVFGLRWAVFWSLPANKLRTWMSWKEKYRHGVMRVLRWEVETGVKFHPDLAERAKNERWPLEKLHQIGAVLEAKELESKKALLFDLSKRSIGHDIANYFIECVGCHTFASAMFLAGLTGWPGFYVAFLTALAYVCLAVFGIPVISNQALASGGCGSKK